MDFIDGILIKINSVIWGIPLIVLMMGSGIFMTIRLKFYPWRNLIYAIKSVFKVNNDDKKQGDISPFQSLMTSLAATIGTGSIVGVATAMVAGGPGALVWMCIFSMLLLSIKYSESVLSIKYRTTNQEGDMCGGPMYAMHYGIKKKYLSKALAIVFAIATIFSSFGTGNMTQANSISSSINTLTNIPDWVSGLIVSILTICVLIGGIKSIGKVCGILVPFMAIFYFTFSFICIVANFKNIPFGLYVIFKDAFSIKAVGGATGGTLIIQAIRWGMARGIFSNESGMGTAAIAAAAAKTDHPSKQGYMNMTGAFFCTIFVCTMTGLVIASSGFLHNPVYDSNGVLLGYSQTLGGEPLNGSALSISAFSSVLGKFGGFVVGFGLLMFSFSTILGWEYYGEKSLEYLFRNKKRFSVISCKIYRIVFSIVTFFGATLTIDIVWQFSDIMNGLMAIPNILCILILSNVVVKECLSFQKTIKETKDKSKKIKSSK